MPSGETNSGRFPLTALSSEALSPLSVFAAIARLVWNLTMSRKGRANELYAKIVEEHHGFVGFPATDFLSSRFHSSISSWRIFRLRHHRCASGPPGKNMERRHGSLPEQCRVWNDGHGAFFKLGASCPSWTVSTETCTRYRSKFSRNLMECCARSSGRPDCSLEHRTCGNERPDEDIMLMRMLL